MPLAAVAPNVWEATYRAQEGSQLQYRYNRNNYGYPTHERFEPDRPEAHRTYDVGSTSTTVMDTVTAWRWLPADAPTATVPNAAWPADRNQAFHVGLAPWDFFQDRFQPHVNRTLDRIVGLGVHHVHFSLSARSIVSVDPLELRRESHNTFSTPELDAAVSAARQRGLQVSLGVGIETDPEHLAELDQALHGPHEDAWYRNLVTEWEEAMREVASWADGHGVDVLVLSNQWPFWGQPTSEQRALLDEWVGVAIRNVSAVFAGNLTVDYYDGGNDFTYYRELDWLGDKWWWRLAQTNETNVADLRAAARSRIEDYYAPVHARYGKPFYVSQIGYASYDGAAGGYDLPDEGGPVWENYPENPAYPFDFQEQADAHHAVLAELVATPWVAGANAFGYAYWDQVDKSPGVRAKPAEQVWANWAMVSTPHE